MKILVGIPYHPKKRYCADKVFDWVENQTYKDVEVILRFHLGTFGEPDAVKTQREFFRNIAVEKDCDYFYSMGCDTIPPLDVLDKLLAHQKDVVGALYRQRKDHDPQPIAWRHGSDHKSFMDEPDDLVQVDGMGMDAVLFSRAAFTSVSYFDWTYPDDDYPYYDRLRGKQFTIWLDKSLICKHYMKADYYV